MFFGMTGALFFWFIGGFKRRLDEELSDVYYYRNILATAVVWLLVVLLLNWCAL